MAVSYKEFWEAARCRLHELGFNSRQRGTLLGLLMEMPLPKCEQYLQGGDNYEVKAMLNVLLNQEKAVIGEAAQNRLEGSIKRLAGEVERMKRGSTWTPATVKIEGQKVLQELSIKSPDVGSLLGNMSVESTRRAALMSIIERHFEQLELLEEGGSEDAPVQQQWFELFKELRSTSVPGAGIPCFKVCDTSVAKYLTNPTAKADFTFYANTQMLWPTVVWFAKAKASLRPQDVYEEVLGQLSDSAQRLFMMQPQRPFVVEAALGADSMELLCFRQDADSDWSWRTGKLALDPHGPAGELLLHLFSAGPHVLGHNAPEVPEPFSVLVDGQAHCLSSFECLRAPSSSSALSTAYLSQLSDGQPIVVKLGDDYSITREEQQLRHAQQHVRHLANVVASGDLPNGMSYLAIQPVGRHLGAYDSPGTIAQALLDAAHAITDLHKLSILHCDISSNNLLVTPDGRGLLIDLGSALEAGRGTRRSGTALFSAFSVQWGEPNTVSSDLESLFHTLLHIVLDGEVPGSRVPSAARIEAVRLMAMLNKHRFQSLLQRAWDSHPSLQPLQPLVEQLHRLFFEASSTRIVYNTAVAPDDFIRICKEQLARLRPQADADAGAPSSQRSAPADGFGVSALPVRKGYQGQGWDPARGKQLLGRRTLLQPVRRRGVLLPRHAVSVPMRPPLPASQCRCFARK